MKHASVECGWAAARTGKRQGGVQSLTQGQGHKEMLRRVAAHRHGEDFNADIDNEYSYKKGVWTGVRRQRGHTGGKH